MIDSQNLYVLCTDRPRSVAQFHNIHICNVLHVIMEFVCYSCIRCMTHDIRIYI